MISLLAFAVILVVPLQTFASDLWIIQVSVDGGSEVVNITNPSISWRLSTVKGTSVNITQSAYQILVASSEELLETEEPDLWNSGKVHSNQTLNVEYKGKDLRPGQTAYYAVKVWDQNDKESDYREGKWMREFTMDQWSAKWIGAPRGLQEKALKDIEEVDKDVMKSHPGLKPVLYFRKTFYNDVPVKSATIHCTAKGVFTGYLTEPYGLHNGNIWSFLKPGWTNYNKTIQYHSFDLSYELKDYTNNTIGIMVSPGWYSGYIGSGENHSLYGNEQSFLFELHIEFKNGSTRIITSDDTWKVTTGALVYSDILQGELFYENRQLYNWLNYTYDDSHWSQVVTTPIDRNVKFVSDSVAAAITTPPLVQCLDYWKVGNHTWVYAFETLVTGQLDLRVSDFPYNARVQVRYAEAVHPNGSIYAGNHGSALTTDTFVLNDADNRPNFIFVRPFFTYHSFRYVEVSGYPVAFDIDSQIHAFDFSQQTVSSKFYSDNKDLQNLGRMVASSQEANFLSVPTNSPSRQNRLGWLEPAGLFSLTAMYNGDSNGFFKKWLRDVREAQSPSGAYSNVAPTVLDSGDASPGSGSAPIIISYNLYRMYGDIKSVAENYEANQKWMNYVSSSNPNFLFVNNAGKNEGDYGNFHAETPKDLVATAYFGYDALLMSFMANILGKKADQSHYEELHKNISFAFAKEYVNMTDGKIKGDTQTAYVIAVAFKILRKDLIPKAVKHLVDNIKSHDYHLTTGYVGTAFVLPVLSDHGYSDIAYRILQQQTAPSWGYMLENDATSVWEHWDSWTNATGFRGSSFTSLGLASFGRWLYQYAAGINVDDEEVGFKKIIFKPHIGTGVNEVFAVYYSNYGMLSCQWVIDNGTFGIKVEIPANARGKLILPFVTPSWEKELESGIFQFEIPLNSTNVNLV